MKFIKPTSSRRLNSFDPKENRVWYLAHVSSLILWHSYFQQHHHRQFVGAGSFVTDEWNMLEPGLSAFFSVSINNRDCMANHAINNYRYTHFACQLAQTNLCQRHWSITCSTQIEWDYLLLGSLKMHLHDASLHTTRHRLIEFASSVQHLCSFRALLNGSSPHWVLYASLVLFNDAFSL